MCRYKYVFSAISFGALSRNILKDSDISDYYEKKNYNIIKDNLEKRTESDNQIFHTIYNMWQSIFKEFLDSSMFKNELLNASSRPSFSHQKTTRQRMIERLNEFNESIINGNRLSKPWSNIIDENKGIFKMLDKYNK